MMWTTLVVIAVVFVAALLVLNQAKFGKNPDANKNEKIKSSKNFENGAFKNLTETPMFTGEKNFLNESLAFLFQKTDYRQPADSMPFVETDLANLNPNQDVLVWLGHSSYFIRLEGKNILVDPVLSGNAAPFRSMNKAFKGSDEYKAESIPNIDYLFISHDHWDHLDYQSVLKLKHKVKHVICPLGVGSHFEHWGYGKEKITELDWYEKATLPSDWEIYATPAQHFSGRGIVRNKTLWASFVLKTPEKSIYIGGDSGYGTHFSEIGKRFGPFNLAILELGQYDKSWRHIHLLPKEFFRAASELKAQKAMGVHNSKFALGRHAWFAPLQAIGELSKNSQIPLLTPMLGAPVKLNDSTQTFTRWWVGLK